MRETTPKTPPPPTSRGNPRKAGIIDLGAYEGNANGNGISNYGDYAAGGDPAAPDDPTLRPKLTGNQLTFSFRDNAADVVRRYLKSGTLLPGSWTEMIVSTDCTVSTTISSGGRTLTTLTLSNSLLSTNPWLFFRGEFTATP